MSFQKIVSSRMKELNLSVRGLSKKCGVDSSLLSKILKSKRNPPADEKVIIRIARAIEVEPDYLIFSCGRVPSKWQSFFERDDISKFLKEIFSGAFTRKRGVSPTKQTQKPKAIKKPYLPDEIL